MSCSPQPAKLSAPMNSLADSDLEEIFKPLPLYERLIVSEVCRRWHSISRKSWVDISKVDLTPIPGRHIWAIVTQCPNLQSVVAVEKSFDSNELTCLAKVPSLKRVSFIGCDFKLNPDKSNIVKSIFSDSLGNASWTELILHCARFLTPRITANVDAVPLIPAPQLFDVSKHPASLTRLQLSGLCLCEEFSSESGLSLDGLERLEHLECFILHSAPNRRSRLPDYGHSHELIMSALEKPNVCEKISRLKNLKQLCVGPAICLNVSDPTRLEDLVSSLLKLEVIFFTHVIGSEIAEDLAELITSNSTLRILVLSGMFLVTEPIELPARKRFPRGFCSDPLPLLHVFVGKEASVNIRFTKSASDAAIIHSINQPMPEFLEREDIASIFKGVWLAEKIKEMAKHGGKLWKYETYDTASSIQHI